ncbi:hypothetical protein GCM10010441_62730 [Kitasatospora paracochleata]|uniref:Uncharacterized protein n=1 Tax=Kitasatospora paracochleata TaxID=58354 RepID=A0ABT1IRA2_9ACTN|nr:hypothetical protein [Kitasatospora paracochleata]MCP2307637.1 hypothetical protein [Kitasatospora paracochleata]
MTDRDEPQLPGPRHAAPRVGVRSRLRGRALAIAAVPTALLVGAAYTPTLASADTTAGKACASTPDRVLEETPVPKSEIKVLPDSGTSTAAAGRTAGTGSTVTKSAVQPGTAAAVPAVFTGTTGSSTGTVQQAGLIDDLLNGIIHPGGTPTPTPTPSAKTATATPAPTPSAPAGSTGATVPSAPAASAPAGRAATPAPSADAKSGTSGKAAAAPTASASADPNCMVSARGLTAKAAPSGHVVPDQNWVLHSSKLALHGSVFNGIYDVKTESGTKRVLKFTTASVDIGDLDMSTIEIPGKTFHVKGRPGSTSTMRNGPITMYVESLSGHLSAIYGLPIPIDLGEITLTPDTLPKWLWDLIGAIPIPLDITLDQAKAVQAGQFGGDLTIPGMKLYNDETPYDG